MTSIARQHGIIVLSIVGLLAELVSCKDLAGTPPLPAGTSSPSISQSAVGAVETAVAAQVFFQSVHASYIPVSGELTDELQANGRDNAVSTAGTPVITTYGDVMVDARLLDQATVWNPPGSVTVATDTLYSTLQETRGLLSQAIGGLATYAPDSLVLRGEMYALLGYTEIMLADFYCSGVPLSTLDFQGNFTYQPGSTTSQIYNDAVTKFDTAITLASANARIVNLANVGKGRVYLALGDYASAGQAVSAVPSTFQFTDSVLTCGSTGNTCSSASGTVLVPAHFNLARATVGYSVSDREGGSGLPFVSSGDSRTADTVIGTSSKKTAPRYWPKKYPVAGVSALVLASGLEAQLITAEADLNTGNVAGMFTILNALRKGNISTSGMPTLTDPGTFSAELDTLFTERAAWLFIDGHRQGDLRRLMRNYVNGQGIHVVANQYPSGDYGYGVGLYGSSIDAPVSATELVNPHFRGCLSRD